MAKKVLIIGTTGGIGGAAAAAFAARGWDVSAMHREPGSALAGLLAGSASWASDAKWVQGDAMDEADVMRAAEGMDVIVHGANPPGYKKWKKLAIPMLANSIAAAKASGARLIFPGNVYNFGPDTWPLLTEGLPQKPKTSRGKVRVRMEKMLEKASKGGVQVLIVRAGDFFAANAPGSWFGNAMVKPGRKVKAVTYPGDPDEGHAWAYLPDLAQTMALLAERGSELEAFAVYHFAGHYFERGGDMAEAILDAAGTRRRRIKKLPWGLVRLALPFSATFRGLFEMRYLWRETIQLDNTKLVAFLGSEPHTDQGKALRETLRGLDCL